MRRLLCLFALTLAATSVPAEKPKGELALTLRSRAEAFKGSGQWEEVTFTKRFDPKETAVVICDMWDDHWCKSAAKRCDALAKKAAPVIAALRKKGVTIIHCPSDCMDFYKDSPQRKATLAVEQVKPPKALDLPDVALPIDDSDGGCDDAKPAKSFRAWTRQHAAIEVAQGDYVSDKGTEVYSVLKAKGVKTLLVMGVHTNMCVMNRTFAIKQMTRWGVKCVLVRDLTDAMYNPKKKPFVSHEEGTELVIGHIERHWCPSVVSEQLGK